MTLKAHCDICPNDPEIDERGGASFTRISRRKMLTPDAPGGPVQEGIEKKHWDLCSPCADEVEGFINQLKEKNAKKNK